MGVGVSQQAGACSKPVVVVEEVSAAGPADHYQTASAEAASTFPAKAPEGGLSSSGPRLAADTVIIFDWDDTLLCSSALNSSYVHSRQLEELERAAEAALHAAMSLGEVLIVTNGNGTWVQDSSRRFLPKLVPTLSKLKVVSARALYEQMHPGDPFMWKRVAFTRLLTQERHFPAEPGLNLISLGDQLPEMDASHHAVKLIGGSSLVKTVKFKEAPTVTEIIGQLSRVEQDLSKIVSEVSTRSYSMSRRPLPLQWDNLASYANGWKCTAEDEQPWGISDILTLKDLWSHIF